MIMAADKQDKVLNFSNEREQSGACSSSAEHEKNQGKNFLNVPNKRVQSQTCLSSAERAGLRTKGNVPTLRFPEFKDEWAALSMEDCLIRLENGANYDTNDVEGYPMSRIETISTSHIDYSKVGYSVNLKNAEHYRMLYGDILFSHINSLRHIGKTAYYEAEKPLYHGMNLLLLRCKSEIDSKCMYYLLNNQQFLRKCQVLAKQAVNQASISTSDLRKIELFVPQYDEQIRIAKFLSLIDKRIEAQIRIINEIQSLISGITQKISKHSSIRMTMLSELLVERNEKNTALFPVHSVSVSEGVINQIDYLGRSFAAADTSHYNVAHKGDIIYTKSPTGEFPFGIVKRNAIESNVAVSPLYGVYKPVTDDVAIYLHYYFCSPLNAQNYLHKLIQKGAKNTINITNQRFLENCIPLPENKTLSRFVKLISAVSEKLKLEKSLLETLQAQKRYLLTQMFV